MAEHAAGISAQAVVHGLKFMSRHTVNGRISKGKKRKEETVDLLMANRDFLNEDVIQTAWDMVDRAEDIIDDVPTNPIAQVKYLVKAHKYTRDMKKACEYVRESSSMAKERLQRSWRPPYPDTGPSHLRPPHQHFHNPAPSHTRSPHPLGATRPSPSPLGSSPLGASAPRPHMCNLTLQVTINLNIFAVTASPVSSQPDTTELPLPRPQAEAHAGATAPGAYTRTRSRSFSGSRPYPYTDAVRAQPQRKRTSSLSSMTMSMASAAETLISQAESATGVFYDASAQSSPYNTDPPALDFDFGGLDS